MNFQITRFWSRHPKTCHTTKEQSWAFLKNVIKRKGKKSNVSISRTNLYSQKNKFCMQFFSKNVFFEYEKHFAVEKKHKKKIGGNFKNVLKKIVVAIKRMLVIQFPYMETVWLAFFLTKRFSFSFRRIHKNLCQNKKKVLRISMTPFKQNVWNLYDLYYFILGWCSGFFSTDMT